MTDECRDGLTWPGVTGLSKLLPCMVKGGGLVRSFPADMAIVEEAACPSENLQLSKGLVFSLNNSRVFYRVGTFLLGLLNCLSGNASEFFSSPAYVYFCDYFNAQEQLRYFAVSN